MLKRLKQAWATEPLTVAALGAVALGFLMWAAPLSLRGIGIETQECFGEYSNGSYIYGDETVFDLLLVSFTTGCRKFDFYWADYWFQFDRLPAVLFFFTLAAFLYWYGTRSTIVSNIRRR
jgi:hypothetical protein